MRQYFRGLVSKFLFAFVKLLFANCILQELRSLKILTKFCQSLPIFKNAVVLPRRSTNFREGENTLVTSIRFFFSCSVKCGQFCQNYIWFKSNFLFCFFIVQRNKLSYLSANGVHVNRKATK